MILPNGRRRVEQCEKCGRPFKLLGGQTSSNKLIDNDVSIRRVHPVLREKNGVTWHNISMETNYRAKLCDRCADALAAAIRRWVEKPVEVKRNDG